MHIIRKVSTVVTCIATIETNLISLTKANLFDENDDVNTALIVIIVIAVVVIVVLACVLLYLWWKRQLAEGESVKAGFTRVQKNRIQKESGVDGAEEKETIDEKETPGNFETPGNDEQEVYMAQLAAEKDKKSKEQTSNRMNDSDNLTKKAEMFGGQLKDKQVGQKMVETDIVHQMHDDKHNKTPGYTPGYTPGDNRFVR